MGSSCAVAFKLAEYFSLLQACRKLSFVKFPDFPSLPSFINCLILLLLVDLERYIVLIDLDVTDESSVIPMMDPEPLLLKQVISLLTLRAIRLLLKRN